jgi:hypothetical protein
MLNSSLIEILKSFSRDEISEFGDMVCSPFYNKKSAVTKFWNEINKYAPDFISVKLSREKIYTKVFPGKEFNYGTMKNLVHDLTRLAETFIEIRIYNKKTAEQNFNLLEGFLERGLNNYFEKNVKSLEAKLENKKGTRGYHQSRYLIELLKQNCLIQQDKHYLTRDNIKSANDYLTMGYFIDIFDNNYNSLFMQNELSGNNQNFFIKKVLDFFDNNPIEMDYRVKIYYNAFMLVSDGGLEYFYQLRELFEQNIDKLSEVQKYNFCIALANFSSIKNNAGLSEFSKSEYEIYRYMIDNRIYGIDNVKNMDGAFYLNVSAKALDADEFQWALYFIEKFKSLLAEDVRENYYFHAMIEYNIKLKNFGEALRYLSRIKHTNYTDKLNIKKWDLITSYELGHFEELRYMIDSTKHFIKNDTKLSALNKERLNNFTLIVSKLVYLNENKGNQLLKNDIHLLKEEINKLDSSHKNWLLEKISELEKGAN